MTLDRPALIDTIARQHEREPFCGVVCVRERGEVVLEAASGLAHRAERIPNTVRTRFGIASGTKTLTSIAVARLVEQGRLAFDARLADCVDVALPGIDREVTLHHLLTHSAGIPDYFDEAVMDDYEELWRERPMYAFRTPSDFLPLFAHLPMRAAPGSTWAYNNAGYLPCEDGGWRTNAYAVPIVGGADGGLFATAHDLVALWDALLEHRLVGPATLERMLAPHWPTDSDGDEQHYGYGIWTLRREGRPDAYAMAGEDPGVFFRSRFDPTSGRVYVLFGNTVAAARAMDGAIAPILNAV